VTQCHYGPDDGIGSKSQSANCIRSVLDTTINKQVPDTVCPLRMKAGYPAIYVVVAFATARQSESTQPKAFFEDQIEKPVSQFGFIRANLIIIFFHGVLTFLLWSLQ
jgi:hypothetical protein